MLDLLVALLQLQLVLHLLQEPALVFELAHHRPAPLHMLLLHAQDMAGRVSVWGFGARGSGQRQMAWSDAAAAQELAAIERSKRSEG